MGQKVNPNGLRLGIIRNWESRWIAKNNAQTGQWLIEDYLVRKHIFKVCKLALISHIEIERSTLRINVYVHCFQPGIVLGKDMHNLKTLKKQVGYIVGKKTKVNINVLPLEKTAFSARIIAREIADAIENRTSFRVAQKLAIKRALASGIKGIKTRVAGRLGGVEMAREEGYSEGIVPLTTLRADIDYALEEAFTTYGVIGVKVWIYRGDLFKQNLTTIPSKPKTFDKNKAKKSYKKLTLSQKPTNILIYQIPLQHAQVLLEEENKSIFFTKEWVENDIKKVLFCQEKKGKIVGEISLEKSLLLEKEDAWKKYGRYSCFYKKDFDELFAENDKIWTLFFNGKRKYHKTMSLTEFGISDQKQGFYYLKNA